MHVYIYMHVYVCLYMYVCVYVSMYVCMIMCVYAYMYMYICILYWGELSGEKCPTQNGRGNCPGNCPGELSYTPKRNRVRGWVENGHFDRRDVFMQCPPPIRAQLVNSMATREWAEIERSS